MKGLKEHLLQESMINRYDSGYSGISKVLSNHKIKNIDFVFDVSGSTYGKNYNKWTDQADMIVKQVGQWGIRERDCNFWEASDGEVRHLRLGQTPTRGGYTTTIDVIMNELNPNPYSLVVIFTDDIPLMKAIHTLRFRCPVVFVSDNTTLTGQDSLESRGIYFIHDNDLNTKAPWPGVLIGKGAGTGVDKNDIKNLIQMMETGIVRGDDDLYYAVSPESILLVYSEDTYPVETIKKAVAYLEREGYKWKYRTDKEALRDHRDTLPLPGSEESKFKNSWGPNGDRYAQRRRPAIAM